MNIFHRGDPGVSRMRQLLLSILVIVCAFAAFAGIAVGQNQSPAAPINLPVSTLAATPEPTPIPLGEVVAQAEAATASLNNIEAEMDTDQIASAIEEELPDLRRQIDARLNEDERIFSSQPSLETFRSLDSEWKMLATKVTLWRRSLTTRATALDREITRLRQLDQIWSTTLGRAEGVQTPSTQSDFDETARAVTPPEILQRMQSVVAAIEHTRAATEKRRGEILTLQNNVAEQDARIAGGLSSVALAREETIDRLFVKDSHPIWSAALWVRPGQHILQDSQNSFASQWHSLNEYAARQLPRFALHAMTFMVLIVALYWARRRVQPWIVAEPSLEGVSRVFNVPVATALVLSIVMSGWFYPQSPRMLNAILGAAALVPTVIILRQLVERHLFSVLNALVIFYFIDLLRTVASPLPLASRLLFLAEMLGGIIFVAWLVKSKRLFEFRNDEGSGSLRIARAGVRIGGLAFFAALIANALGYVSIATLVGDGVLGSAYLVVILLATVRIADGLIMFMLRIHPITNLGMVRRHRHFLRQRVQRCLRWIAVLGWSVFTLELFSLRAPVVEQIRTALGAKLEVGSVNISLGNVAAFLITVWLAFMLSRFLRFILEEDIYPRINLARGIPYAVSTMLHYVVLLVGFLFAVAALGIDMTKFTILAGAFGVGLGFGLQNIVNNFVSGLILLFERPVKVGDVVQLGEYSGDLRRIGLRASVVRTWEGSEVIVPNGDLISEEVVNWTLSDQQRRIEINVGVAYGTDPEHVIKLLTRVAAGHAEVMTDPGPQTLFIGFGDNALDFQLRAWTVHFGRWMAIKSELTVGVNAALRDANISIPFPQRDLHIQTIAPEVLKAALVGGNNRSDSSRTAHRNIGAIS